MNSIVTQQRPDLWQRALALAVRTTGYDYAPKLPLPDGTIYACGGHGGYGVPNSIPSKPKTPEELEKERVQRIKNDIDQVDRDIARKKASIEELDERKKTLEQEIGALIEKKKKLEGSLSAAACVVFVPEGAMEWLLHEVGHYVGASPEERRLQSYGLKDVVTGKDGDFERIVVPSGHIADREWQAWAFEEIVLAPYGPAREFAPPTQRDGVAFSKAGPMPMFAMRHVERAMQAERVDVEEWRAIYGEWIRFERGLAVPSWQRVN